MCTAACRYINHTILTLSDLILLKLRFFIFLLALSLSPQVYADSVQLIINGKSIHDEKKNFNESNTGIGFEYDFEEKDKWINFVNGGFFKDSLSNTSKYLGGGSKRRFMLGQRVDSWHIDLGISAFMMTRKDHKNYQPFFGALPYFSIGTNRVAINATYIPSVSPKLMSLWFFQASIKLSEW